MDIDDAVPPEYQTFDPEELGWIRRAERTALGYQVYERPDGKIFVFGPDEVPRITKAMHDMPKKDDE